jgi:hypothetical protein
MISKHVDHLNSEIKKSLKYGKISSSKLKKIKNTLCQVQETLESLKEIPLPRYNQNRYSMWYKGAALACWSNDSHSGGCINYVSIALG